MGRDDLEKEKGISKFQKAETDWLLLMKSDQRSLQQKFSVLKVTRFKNKNHVSGLY